jgi:hypothetical protein
MTKSKLREQIETLIAVRSGKPPYFTKGREVISRKFYDLLQKADEIDNRAIDEIEWDWYDMSSGESRAYKFYRIVGDAIDSTCGVCKVADGMVFPQELGVAGFTKPPFHPNCRCEAKEISGEDDEALWDALASEPTQKLVTREQLEAMGWFAVTNEMVSELNAALEKYEITDKNSIAHLIAQATIETGWNRSVIQSGAEFGGGGYIQLSTQAGYYGYVTNLIVSAFPGVGIYLSPSKHNTKQIMTNYIKIIEEAKKLGYDISEYTRIVESDSPKVVVGEEFAWDSACYFWTTQTYGNGEKMTANDLAINYYDVDFITLTIKSTADTASKNRRRAQYEIAYKIFVEGELK